MSDTECHCAEQHTSSDVCTCGEKGAFHIQITELWDEIPDDLKDMIRSLWQQKKAVLEQVRMWAELSNHTKLRSLCDEKIEKVQRRISEEGV